ncbi:hypothetical protein A7982_13587 [Minicystis rosea]|nr:hypothetical protein A7982_13587 [Minicystis rosea]
MCALRVASVIETFRPLPVEPVAGAPSSVRGVAIVRGSPVAVVRLASILGPDDGAPGARFVTLRSGVGCVALEVDEVIGIRRISTEDLAAAAPLLGVALREHVEALGVLDGQLVAVIGAARLLPEGWAP